MKRIILFAILIGAFGWHSFANVYCQGITLTVKGASIVSIFKEVERQSDFRIIYDPVFFEKSKEKSISVVNASIDKVLEICLEGLSLTYTITNASNNKYVIIKRNKTDKISEYLSRPSNAPIELMGRVVDEKGNPVVGATVAVRGSETTTFTASDGSFMIKGIDSKASIIISSVGFESQIISLKGKSEIVVKLNVVAQQMKEVVVMNTGYQKVAKERVTGSFIVIDSTLLNRSIEPSILNRLDGVTPGLLFDKRDPYNVKLRIRGLFSINEQVGAPLIVVNDFPFEGDINSINPNDVLNITILRDAAAASIWGAKAGNGVIVITTKDAQFNQPLRVSISTNINITGKPKLLELPVLGASDMIDVERYLFEKGVFDADLGNEYTPVTEVVEILNKVKTGNLSEEQGKAQIDKLRLQDVRNDYLKFVYRSQIRQQHSLNLSLGNNIAKYYFSVGYDKNRNQIVKNNDDRLTLSMRSTIKIVRNLQLLVGANLSFSNNNFIPGNYGIEYGAVGVGTRNLPMYSHLVNSDGTARAIDRTYRGGFVDTLGGGELLDWKYKLLDEINNGQTKIKSNSLLANLGLTYNLLNLFTFDLKYQLDKSTSTAQTNNSVNSYFARDLINSFSNFSAFNSYERYPVPVGGILDTRFGETISHKVRGQINYSKTLGKDHKIDFLLGGEIRDTKFNSNSNRLFGYNSNTLSSSTVDFVRSYPKYHFGTNINIPNNSDLIETVNRFVSYYANASYDLKDKYTLTASFRKDASNLFGVKSNQKGSPFLSVGGLWKLSNEAFYNFKLIPTLNFRVSYGSGGNVNSNASAYTIISYGSALSNPITNLPFAQVLQPGNPELRWEKIKTFNVGLDFSIVGKILTGSVDYFKKKSIDVLGVKFADITTGATLLSTNSANMKGNGIDVSLTINSISTKDFKVSTRLAFSTIKNTVSKYLLEYNTNGFVSDGRIITPLAGYNPYLVVSYKWGKLDPQNGDPQGYVDGKLSKDYATILKTPFNQQVISGSALPAYFGNILNIFSYKNVSMSTNITYRLKYYFRRATISNSQLYTSLSGHRDYLKRWQKTGDENITDIPSMQFPVINLDRETFYTNSEATVEKGDFIKLNDFNFSYSFNSKQISKLPFDQLSFFANVSNLNILLWRANKAGLDPENQELPASKTWVIGLRANF